MFNSLQFRHSKSTNLWSCKQSAPFLFCWLYLPKDTLKLLNTCQLLRKDKQSTSITSTVLTKCGDMQTNKYIVISLNISFYWIIFGWRCIFCFRFARLVWTIYVNRITSSWLDSISLNSCITTQIICKLISLCTVRQLIGFTMNCSISWEI